MEIFDSNGHEGLAREDGEEEENSSLREAGDCLDVKSETGLTSVAIRRLRDSPRRAWEAPNSF